MLAVLKIFAIILYLLTIQLVGLNRCEAADEIHHVEFLQWNDSNYLVIHLFAFQIVEGNYEKGSVSANGFNTSELMVINLSSQKVLVVKNYGAYDSEGAFEVLGCTDSLIWIYSKKYKAGLQALDLRTLKPDVSQARFYGLMKGWTGSFIDPPWDKITQFYRFLPLQNEMLITNYNNQQFVVGLNDFIANQVKEPITLNANEWKSYAKMIENPYDTIHLYGTNIYQNGNAILPDQHFIEGAFMINKSPQYLYNYYQDVLNSSQQKVQDLMDKMSKNRANKGSDVFNEMVQTLKKYEIVNKNARQNMDALNKGEKTDLVMLRPDSTGILVLSSENKNADARLLITRISYTDDIYKVKWSSPLPGMFYNIPKAKDTKEFKRYFDDKLPDSKFIRFQVVDNQLVVIYLLQVAVVDLDNGEIVWRLKL